MRGDLKYFVHLGKIELNDEVAEIEELAIPLVTPKFRQFMN